MALLLLPTAFAHTDIPYDTYDNQYGGHVYDHGTDINGYDIVYDCYSNCGSCNTYNSCMGNTNTNTHTNTNTNTNNYKPINYNSYYNNINNGNNRNYANNNYVNSNTYPYYNAGYNSKGKLYEKYGYETEYEETGYSIDRNGNNYNVYNTKYSEKNNYETKVEYNNYASGLYGYNYFYDKYDPRYDGRKARTITQDYYNGLYRPSLYSSGRLEIENDYGPVYYNYRGQRYGYDAQGKRFYY